MFRAKRTLIERAARAIGRKPKKTPGVKSGLLTAGGVAGLAVVSAIVSARRTKRNEDNDAE